MSKKPVYCQVCARQIIPNSTEDTERTIGRNYGNGECLLMVGGMVCPKCSPEEIAWGKLMEGEQHEDYV